MELSDSNPLVENLRQEQTSHLRGARSFQERAELPSHRLIDGGSLAMTPPHQQPSAQEVQSRARMGAFYDPVRDIVLLLPESSPVAANSVLGNTVSHDGNIETVMATELRPNLSEPSFLNIAGNNTQFSVRQALVKTDPTTALRIRFSRSPRPPTSVFRQTSATAVETDQSQTHSQVKGPLIKTPSQPVTQASPSNAPRVSPIPQRTTRLTRPAMYNDIISQEPLLRQSTADEHEQVRAAASHGFTTTLQSEKKRSSNAAFSPPPEKQEEPPRKKLHNRGGARPGAGRPATKILRQLESETAQQSLRAGSLWCRLTSTDSRNGGGSGHAVHVSGAGSLSSPYTGFPLAPSADPHIQPSSSLSGPAGPGDSGLGPGCAPVAGAVYTTGSNTGLPSTSSAGTRNQPTNSLSATVGPSDLSITSFSGRKRRGADGADIHSVSENFSAPMSGSIAVSVATAALEILKWQEEQSPRSQLPTLDIDEFGDADGRKEDGASGDVMNEKEREEQVAQHKSAEGREVPKKGNTPWPQSRNLRENGEGLRSAAALPKSKAEETRGAKEPDCKTQSGENERRQGAAKGTKTGMGRRKTNAITPLAECAADDSTKDQPPAKRAETAAMSSPAVPETPVSRSARLMKPTPKVIVNTPE